MAEKLSINRSESKGLLLRSAVLTAIIGVLSSNCAHNPKKPVSPIPISDANRQEFERNQAVDLTCWRVNKIVDILKIDGKQVSPDVSELVQLCKEKDEAQAALIEASMKHNER